MSRPEMENNPKVEHVYQYLIRYWTEKRMMPSIREIGEAVGISSTSQVNYYLKSLERAGRIKREPFKSRAIVLNGSVAIGPRGQA